MKKLWEWLSQIANVTGILSFMGVGVSAVLAWFGQPIVSVVVLCLGVLGLGIVLGRRMERSSARAAAVPVGVAEARTTLLDSARAIADQLTRDPWDEFPAWKWTIRGSKDALQVVMDRVQDRLVPGMRPSDLDELVRGAVRMYIREAIDRRAAQARAQQESYAMQMLRRQNSWIHSWRYR